MGSAKFDRYVPSSAGIEAILKGPIARAAVSKRADAIRGRAASMFGAKGYRARVKPGKTRVRGVVYTGDWHAMKSNRKHNTLAKAKGGR